MHYLVWLFLVAFLLYSLVILTHKSKRRLVLWMVLVFGTALAIDLFVTTMVCIVLYGGFEWSAHAVAGILCLVIMAVHFTFALLAVTVHGKFEGWFNRYSFRAWLFWIAATLSGFLV